MAAAAAGRWATTCSLSGVSGGVLDLDEPDVETRERGEQDDNSTLAETEIAGDMWTPAASAAEALVVGSWPTSIIRLAGDADSDSDSDWSFPTRFLSVRLRGFACFVVAARFAARFTALANQPGSFASAKCGTEKHEITFTSQSTDCSIQFAITDHAIKKQHHRLLAIFVMIGHSINLRYRLLIIFSTPFSTSKFSKHFVAHLHFVGSLHGLRLSCTGSLSGSLSGRSGGSGEVAAVEAAELEASGSVGSGEVTGGGVLGLGLVGVLGFFGVLGFSGVLGLVGVFGFGGSFVGVLGGVFGKRGFLTIRVPL
jgi:hypothetical protein